MKHPVFWTFFLGGLAFCVGIVAAFYFEIDPFYTAFGCCFTEYIGVVICNYIEEKDKKKKFK